jgi:hypothetical protein
MEKLNKMIETLAKFARDGKETTASNRLKNNLVQIAKSAKLLDADMLDMLCKKQSLDSCLMASVKVIELVAAKKAIKNAVAAEKRAATIAAMPEKKVVRGYYTNDICQSWVSENDPEFDMAEYEAFQRSCRLARAGRL